MAMTAFAGSTATPIAGDAPRKQGWIALVLLLPGLCSLVFSAILIGSGGSGSSAEYVPLLLFCFLVGAGGVALIVFAIRR